MPTAAGSYIVPRLLEQLGCEVVRVHCEPDGTFPRGAEPIPENLGDLREAVKKNGCAVGFAVDPDADRCALVDGMNEDVAAKYGCGFSRAKVGEINVSLQMIENGCVIGGEGNGGVILPALHYGRDSLVAAALVLSWMAHHNGGPEKFVAENPAYVMPKKKFELGDKKVADILPKVKAEFAGWKSDERDGLWLGSEKSWVHVRASNTEPVIRVIAEAPTAAEAEELCSKVEKLI